MAGVLWLLGVEVLPNLHLAFHDDDHTHGPDGAIVHRATHDHRGDDRAHAAAHHAAHHHDEPAGLAPPHADHHHPAVLAPHDDDDHHPLAAGDEAEPAWSALAAHEHAPIEEHEHGAAAHDHDVPAPAHDHAAPDPTTPAIDHAPSGHTAAGIAHRAIALHRPPPPLLEPLPAPPAVWLLDPAPAPQRHDTWRARPTARGPPAMT